MTVPLDAIAGGTTLLTVNKRLAGELRARSDAMQAAAGRQVWESADILPWEAWLARLYDAMVDRGLIALDLLDATQERLLWQSIIERDPGSAPLLRPTAAAQVAQRSAQLLGDWQLADHPLVALGGEQTRRLLGWQRALARELDRRGQMTRAQLLPMVTAAFAARSLPAPGDLVLAGFDDLSPAQQALLDALAATGCRVDTLAEPQTRAACRLLRAADVDSEIRLAARWADAWRRRAPAARIAVVAPQITALRSTLERVFRATLAPAAYLNHGTARPPFNLSLGSPLAESPLVDAALCLLELLRGEHALARFGRLLRSPFIGGHGAEHWARALLDAALRDDGLPRITLRRLRYRAGQYDAGDRRHCPRLNALLDALQARLDGLPQRDSPAAWAGHLQRLLQDAGWPGDGTLSSEEFQQHERLRRVFSELAATAKVRPSLHLGEALRMLRGLAQETLFQAESPATAIQILGPLEAAGLRFDAIWLLGVHDREWPPTPQPDPLLPTALQRELGMPHASAERELAFATALTARLTRACNTLIASYPAVDGDRELRPSPLVADWAAADDALSAGPDSLPAHAICADHAGLQPLRQGPLPSPAAAQRGGAGLLAAQSACPFQAVARYRLGAAPLAEPGFAVDGALGGTLVHELLQRVWQALGDSAALAARSRESLTATVRELAQAVLDDIGRRRPDLFTARFRDLEAQRLSDLVSAWLDVERARGQAFRVVALERRQQVTLGGLELTTRVDRIDELGDGSLAVIDYKTGRRVGTDGWFDERLSEPQLPLYSVQAEAPLGAALLARVRNDASGCRFVGLSRLAGIAAGVTTAGDDAPDWQQTLTRWRHALTTLAAEFAAGRADPTPSPEACEYCPLGSLCRVDAHATEAPDDG